jgi:hypothetical protein
MPPRYAYWTIIADGLPTAFRAADKEELLPTFSRIKHKHPDAEMKWFARGKLWDSPESARQEAQREVRGRDWRPGGTHRDPRQPFKDAKRDRNIRERKRKFERRERHAADGDRRFDQPPRGPEARPRAPRPAWTNREGRPTHPMKRAASGHAKPRGNWRGGRGFEQKSFARNQGPPEPRPSPSEKPPREGTEPRPREGTEPTPPPRPSEPIVPPPGPPERGHRRPPGKRRR